MKTILILSANPNNTDKLRLDEEVREIQAGLERSKKREQFNILTRSALRIDDLRRTLLDHEPQIVHFSGHGAGTQGLALEDHSGQVQLVSTESLAKLFRLFQDTIECVVLNACYSEVQAEAIHQYIDCVVGMNQAIGDRAAIEFATGFYDALGAGRSYDQAYEFGCTAIALESIPESMTPVLKARVRSLGSIQEQPSSNDLEITRSTAPLEKPSQSISITGATVTGQVAQAGGNATQTQQINQEGTDKQLAISDVVKLLSQIEALINISALSDNQKSKATTHLEAAKEATQEKEPDKDYAAKSLQKAVKILKDANDTVDAGQGLWSRVTPLVKQLLPWLGVASHFFGF
jgi:hypothetical protein